MKTKKGNLYNLERAIKEFYQTEPLKQDLATTVANRVFTEQKSNSAISDKILLTTLCLVAAAFFIYIFSLLSEIPVAALLMFTIVIAGLMGLSIKEYSILLKQFNALNFRQK